MLPSMVKMSAIKRYLYKKGPWNNYQSYQYDFADPMGSNIFNETLSQYIASKKGNCVSMPLLFIILGDKMGLDLTASVAPLHVLAKFTESETGRTYNIEATSGGDFSRDKWYQEQMGITDRAIENGIYLKKLTKKETAALIVLSLGEYHFQQEKYNEAIDIYQLVLDYYPKSVQAMLKMGGSYYRLLDKHFLKKYKKVSQIPIEKRSLLKFYFNRNHHFFKLAESLGWQEPPKKDDEKYLKRIRKERELLKRGVSNRHG